MKVAIEGCAHGELEVIYDTISSLEETENIKVDLLIICGDFQATRNEADLYCMAIPQKYYSMCSFYKYYNGEKTAPILTIFVGGNHEASNYLQELPYGGWVAPNIYYMGYSSVLNVAGVRIGGISGIYKGHDYQKGRYEKSPYNNDTKRSVYHVRNLDVFRLKQLTRPIDIFISHDWPTGIHNYGNSEQLLKFKPYFRDDMESGKLGSKPCEDLLKHLQPKYYFAAHLHCKFAALVPHDEKTVTKFLALDKCLPKRRFLQITDIPHDANLTIELKYDLEWLTILHLTNHLISVKPSINYMPSATSLERWQFTPTETEKSLVLTKFLSNLVIPSNFIKTAKGYSLEESGEHVRQPLPNKNAQTTTFCNTLTVDDPLSLLGALSESDDKLENDSTDDCASGEDESDAFETFIQSTPSKLSLSLPKPKYDVSTFSDSGDLSAICESTSILHTAEDVPAEEEEGSSPSIPKKFKRRNASLYVSKDVS